MRVGRFKVYHRRKIGGQTLLYMIYLNGVYMGATYSVPDEGTCDEVVRRASTNMQEVMDKVLSENPLSIQNRHVLSGKAWSEDIRRNPPGPHKGNWNRGKRPARPKTKY